MNHIYTIGETIFDIIFEKGQPKAASVGGAMLNTAVSLGRCGLKVQMITELGQDRVGEMVLDFLHKNGVSTSYIHPVKGLQTPVSLAFLDDEGNARYSFYKHYLKDRLDIQWPPAGVGDVVLFGSFYSLDPELHGRIAGFLRRAKSTGAFLVYDPNIRKNHLDEIRSLMPLAEENISLADLVRGSDEDFENLFNLDDGMKVFERIKTSGCKFLAYTRGSRGAEFYAENMALRIPARDLRVVSTIGAGDSFNAGIIFGMMKKGFAGKDISGFGEGDWQEILAFGIDFASEVCQGYENYISAKDIK